MTDIKAVFKGSKTGSIDTRTYYVMMEFDAAFEENQDSSDYMSSEDEQLIDNEPKEEKKTEEVEMTELKNDEKDAK